MPIANPVTVRAVEASAHMRLVKLPQPDPLKTSIKIDAPFIAEPKPDNVIDVLVFCA